MAGASSHAMDALMCHSSRACQHRLAPCASHAASGCLSKRGAAQQLRRCGATAPAHVPRARCSLVRRSKIQIPGAGVRSQDRDGSTAASPKASWVAHASAGATSAGGASAAAAASGTNTVQTLFNMLNLMLGVGVLAIPYALKRSGWVGLPMLWLLALSSFYAGNKLVQSCEMLEQRKQSVSIEPVSGGVKYVDVARAAFGGWGMLLISVMMYCELYGTCCLLSVAEDCEVPETMCNCHGQCLYCYSYIMALSLIIPTIWLPSLKALSYLGFVSVAAVTSVIGVVAYTYFSGNYPPGMMTYTGSIGTVPAILGVLAFVYSGHGVFPSIRASMNKPQNYPMVLALAFFIVTAAATGVGAAGYCMYGDTARDLVTLNMPPGVPSLICSYMILVNPVAKFALNIEPITTAVARFFTQKFGGSEKGTAGLAAKTLVAISVILVASVTPSIGLLMAFLGAILTVCISIIFPPLCHYKIREGKLPPLSVLITICVVIFGITSAACGGFTGFRNLSAAFGK